MTEFTIEQNWLEHLPDQPNHKLRRAIREVTENFPCDSCHMEPACKKSGYECRKFKIWVSTGK